MVVRPPRLVKLEVFCVAQVSGTILAPANLLPGPVCCLTARNQKNVPNSGPSVSILATGPSRASPFCPVGNGVILLMSDNRAPIHCSWSFDSHQVPGLLKTVRHWSCKRNTRLPGRRVRHVVIRSTRYKLRRSDSLGRNPKAIRTSRAILRLWFTDIHCCGERTLHSSQSPRYQCQYLTSSRSLQSPQHFHRICRHEAASSHRLG